MMRLIFLMLVINKKSGYNIPIANYKIQNKEGGYMMKIKRRIIGVILVAISTVMGVYLGGWLLQTTKILSKKVPSSYSFQVISSFVISYTVQSLSPILFNPVLIIQ